MKKSFLKNTYKSLAQKAPLAMLAISSWFASSGAMAQSDEANSKTPRKISVESKISNMDYSFKNQANSILTWRDLNMLGIDINYQSGNNFGAHFGAETSIGYGYSTDDDIDNRHQGLTQHYTKAHRLTIGAYKNLAQNEKAGIDVSYTYLDNCREGHSLISTDNKDVILGLAENFNQGITGQPLDQAQRYHVVQIKPFYEYDKKLLGNTKSCLRMSIAGMPAAHIGYGYWCSKKQFINLALEMGARITIRWTDRNGKFYIQAFDEACFSCIGTSVGHNNLTGHQGPNNYVQRIKNTKNNIMGLGIGININTR